MRNINPRLDQYFLLENGMVVYVIDRQREGFTLKFEHAELFYSYESGTLIGISDILAKGFAIDKSISKEENPEYFL